MSLSQLETAVAEYVAGVIVDAGRPSPQVSRYHGIPLPGCCTDDGLLTVHWTLDNMTSSFPTSSQNEPCSAYPVATLVIRYLTCWHIPEADGNGLVITDETWETWDAAAAVLADLADVVLRALNRLACTDGTPSADAQAVIDLAPRKALRPIDVAPIPEDGGCAGLVWRLYAGVRSP